MSLIAMTIATRQQNVLKEISSALLKLDVLKLSTYSEHDDVV